MFIQQVNNTVLEEQAHILLNKFQTHHRQSDCLAIDTNGRNPTEF